MRKAIDIRNVPPEIASCVYADARSGGRSITDVVCAILARRYGVAYEPSGYPYVDPSGTSQWNLRIPADLMAAIDAHARSVDGGTKTGVVLMALADHYALATVSPRRRTNGGSSLTPDVIAELRRRHKDGASLRALATEYGIHRKTVTKAIRG